MRKFTFFTLGGLVGGILAGFIAFLFTPDSGHNLRREARNQFDDLMDEAKLAAETRRREMERQLAELTTPAR